MHTTFWTKASTVETTWEICI